MASENDIILTVTRIRKEFEGHGFFTGIVMEKNPNDMYNIRYEDGDEEELPIEDLLPLIIQEGEHQESVNGMGHPNDSFLTNQALEAASNLHTALFIPGMDQESATCEVDLGMEAFPVFTETTICETEQIPVLLEVAPNVETCVHPEQAEVQQDRTTLMGTEQAEVEKEVEPAYIEQDATAFMDTEQAEGEEEAEPENEDNDPEQEADPDNDHLNAEQVQSSSAGMEQGVKRKYEEVHTKVRRRKATFNPEKPPKNAKRVKMTGGCVRCSKVLQVLCNKQKPCDWCEQDDKVCEFYEGFREAEVFDVRCPATVDKEEIDKARAKLQLENRKKIGGAQLRSKLGPPREVVLTKYQNMGLVLETDNIAKTINVLDVTPTAPPEVKEKLQKGDFIVSLDHILAANLKDCSLIEEAVSKHHPLGTTMLLTVSRIKQEEPMENMESRRSEMLTIQLKKPKSLGLTLIESKVTKTITVHKINSDNPATAWEVKAKFKVGDQIHRINGKGLATVQDVVDVMKSVEEGDNLTFVVERVLTTTLPVFSPADHVVFQRQPVPFTSELVISLKKEEDMGLDLRVDSKNNCLVVTSISATAPAQVRKALRFGDCVLSLNGMVAQTRKDLYFIKDKMLKSFVNGDYMTLKIQRSDLPVAEDKGVNGLTSPTSSSLRTPHKEVLAVDDESLSDQAAIMKKIVAEKASMKTPEPSSVRKPKSAAKQNAYFNVDGEEV